MSETSPEYLTEPMVAQPARRRLDDAWYQWCAFGDPPLIWRLRLRLADGELWLAEHGPEHPQYTAAVRGVEKLRAALARAETNPREQQRLATWTRLEQAFLAAERDYLSLVGVPVVTAGCGLVVSRQAQLELGEVMS